MPARRMLAWLVVLGPWWPALVVHWLVTTPSPPTGRLVDWYLHTPPLHSAAWFAGVYAVILYIGSLITKNASIFDFNWSLLPASVYVLHFGYHPLMSPDPLRRYLVIAAVWIWSVRLTGNWLIKGGLGFEDFRYLRFRETMSPLKFQLFSFTALFIVQSAMVFTMCLPIQYAFKQRWPAGWLDFAALAVALGGVTVETVADLQSRAFRARREERMRTHPDEFKGDRPAAPRFITTGLWRYSRHPNYFGEICVWWGIYLFSVAATGDWINWTIIGPITINGLFVGGSVGITEEHELRRKPEYADYQRTTSKLVPWWPSSP
jgi:steroid 5-alpha reductase family enzyme